MYAFLTGPALWIAFAVFFVGLAARFVWYVRGLDWKLDRVAYRQWPKYGIRGALRSIGFWLLPWGTRSWRVKPVFTLVFFAFHIGLLVTPIFLLGHNILLDERWGFALPTLPAGLASFFTVMVMIAGLLLAIRRIALPEVRIISNWQDYLVLLIAVAPFATGYLAANHIGDYGFWLNVHIVTGIIWIVAIPLTKLSHFCFSSSPGRSLAWISASSGEA
jgi:nitrate reductase gamma subunit